MARLTTEYNLRKKQIVELGEMGEELVMFFLSSQGIITLAKDPYDSTKDIRLTNIHGIFDIEVKTQVRNRSMNVLSIERKPTNLKKCMTIHRLIFVEFDDTDFIHIWEVIDREHYTDYPAAGKRMRGWYINGNEIGPGCRQLTKINCPQISARMRALSPSELYKNEHEQTRYSERPTI